MRCALVRDLSIFRTPRAWGFRKVEHTLSLCRQNQDHHPVQKNLQIVLYFSLQAGHLELPTIDSGEAHVHKAYR